LGLDGAERAEFERAGRTAPPVRANHNGPRPSDAGPPLIGRSGEVAGLAALLRRPGVRMVSVIGPAGVGKSRVARAAAERLAAPLAVVELGSIVDAERIPGAVLAAGVAGRGRLVLLDGFDHGEAGAAGLAALLAQQANLRLLVTAREPVRLRAEHRWPLDPLAVPPSGADAEQVAAAAAVRLLVERARAVRPGFTIAAGESDAAGSVVRRLGGNPFAIELAAVRLRVHGLSEVDGQLAVELAVTGGGPATVLGRLIRAAVDRLPRRDAERLAVLATLGSATPAELRRCLAARAAPTDLLDASLALLDAAGLIGVVDQAGQARAVVAGPVRTELIRTPVTLGYSLGRIARVTAASRS
jgi:hypothetical protein